MRKASRRERLKMRFDTEQSMAKARFFGVLLMMLLGWVTILMLHRAWDWLLQVN